MPRLTDLEYRVITILRNLEAGLPVEDNRVEMKAVWPDDPWRAARRIAGHANAAGGDEILWIIGTDEKARKVMGADHLEVSNWWRQVQSHFSEIAPSLTHLNVPYEGVGVVALLINTERLPFIINNNKPGAVEREVPWREGDATRSAKRSDLIQMLVPRAQTPDFQVLRGDLMALREPDEQINWNLKMHLYVRPRTNDRIVIPRHQCSVRMACLGWPYSQSMSILMMLPPHKAQFRNVDAPNQPHSSVIESTPEELLIYGPGKITLQTGITSSDLPVHSDANIDINVTMLPFGAEVPAIIDQPLHPIASEPAQRDSWNNPVGGNGPENMVAKWIMADGNHRA